MYAWTESVFGKNNHMHICVIVHAYIHTTHVENARRNEPLAKTLEQYQITVLKGRPCLHWKFFQYPRTLDVYVRYVCT